MLKHPSAKMVFNYKRNLIKGILNQIENSHPNCKCINMKKLIAFVTNRKAPKHETLKNTTIPYKERSNGKFENSTKDKKLHDVFEKIREEIRCLKES